MPDRMSLSGPSVVQLLVFFSFDCQYPRYSPQAVRIGVDDTDNPLDTDTRYNDKICYIDKLTITKRSLKR